MSTISSTDGAAITLLAIDTVGPACASALAHNGKIIAEERKTMTKGHAEALGPQIEALLDKANITFGDLDRIAVVTGPGSFTAVRVGLSYARGLALALDIPVVGLSLFDCIGAGGTLADDTVFIIEGRGESVFWQRYGSEKDPETGLAVATNEPGNDPLDRVMALVSNADVQKVSSLDSQSAILNLSKLASRLDPALFRAVPLYVRAPDAAPANPLFHVRAPT